jgi:hypothetical protein
LSCLSRSQRCSSSLSPTLPTTIAVHVTLSFTLSQSPLISKRHFKSSHCVTALIAVLHPLLSLSLSLYGACDPLHSLPLPITRSTLRSKSQHASSHSGTASFSPLHFWPTTPTYISTDTRDPHTLVSDTCDLLHSLPLPITLLLSSGLKVNVRPLKISYSATASLLTLRHSLTA